MRKGLCKGIAWVLMLVILATFAITPAMAEETKDSYISSLVDAGFPKSYATKLYTVHQAHPKWKFKAVSTGLVWNNAVAAESKDGQCNVYIKPNTTACATRLYRDQSKGSYVAKGGFDYDYYVYDGSDASQTGWVQATPMAVAYYMNPYTFIGNDIALMQFESLEWNMSSYDAAVPIVETMLSNTFMSSTSNSYNANYINSKGKIKYVDTTGATKSLKITYAEAICTAAKENNMNPCYLTSKIIGEVGSKGSSSVTGTYSSYTGYYNYLNIGAYDSSSGGAVASGLRYAKSYDWTDPQKAIAGGAAQIATYYIARGQNTAYLQKFNVSSNNTYGHQYMTAVNGVVNTTYSTYSSYKKAGILDAQKTFYIPIFKSQATPNGTKVAFSGFTGVGKGVVNSTVNMRSSASYAGEKSGTVNSGDTVTILGGYRDKKVAYTAGYSVDATYYRMYTPLWYKVKTADGKTGYVCEDYVDTKAKATVKKGDTLSLKYTITGDETPRFMSQDTRIATVNANGDVKGVSTGTTKVVIYLTDGQFDVLNVTVSTTVGTSQPSESSTTKSTTSTTKSTTKSTTSSTTKTSSSIPSYSSEGITLKADKNGDYYCYRDGKKVNYTGIAKGDSGTWWYCENGALRTKTIVARNQNGRYYCEKGKVTFTYKGIGKDANGTQWYCEKSKVKTSFTGKYTKGSTIYTIEKGKVTSKKTCPYTEPTSVVNRKKYEYGKITKGNENVKWVQWWLKEKGYYSDKIDGFFGAGTEKAVKKFQKAKGLEADGQVGPATRKALKK